MTRTPQRSRQNRNPAGRPTRPPTAPTTMPFAVFLVLLALASTLLTTCADEPPLTAPDVTAPGVTPPSLAIMDAVHLGGNPYFFFLPPLAADPSEHFDADGFDATQAPEVSICVLADDACGSIIAEYTMEAGSSSETVRVSEPDELYIVNWQTDEFDLSDNETYRVTVLVAETPLGFADVRVYATAQAAKNAITGEDIELKDGRTLPIKFRIEQGAVFVLGPDGGTFTALDGAVTVDAQPEALSEPVAFTVWPVPDLPSPDHILPDLKYEFGPSGITFDPPLTVGLLYDEANLPAGVTEDRLRLFKRAGDSWVVVLGSKADPTSRMIRGEVDGFSNVVGGIMQDGAVCAGDIIIDRLEQLDDLVGCAEVTGDLIIATDDPRITNLDALSGLTSVGGALSMSGLPNLANVDGLSDLASVGGSFFMSGLPHLANVDGLSGLTSAGDALIVQDLDLLANVDGFSSLASVENLLILHNLRLTNVKGLSGLTSIPGQLWISSNAKLASINGLSGVASVGGDVDILKNNALTNLDGLSFVTSVGGNLSIVENGALANVDGLRRVSSVGGDLTVTNNAQLADCGIGLGELLEGGGVVGTVSINNNAFHCNSPWEVIYYSTGICNREIALRTQSHVDVFSCAEVTGQVLIEGPDIANLIGLSELTSVGGSLHIRNTPSLADIGGLAALNSVSGDLNISGNTSLSNLDGLSALTTVGIGLRLQNNASLSNLNGLASLTALGGPLTIDENGSLTDVSGLSELTNVGGWVHIGNNEALPNVDGLAALTVIEGGLHLYGNSVLDNVDGMAAVTSVGIELRIEGNEALRNVDGLSALTSVGDAIHISGNNLLANVNGLSSLATVHGDLSLGSNPTLMNLDGLSAITSVGGNLSIVDNDALANVDGLRTVASVGGDLHIFQNDALANVYGLRTVGSVGGDLTVAFNRQLSECVCGLHLLLADGGVIGIVEIRNNADGCISSDQPSDWQYEYPRCFCQGVWQDLYSYQAEFPSSGERIDHALTLLEQAWWELAKTPPERVSASSDMLWAGVDVRAAISLSELPFEYGFDFLRRITEAAGRLSSLTIEVARLSGAHPLALEEAQEYDHLGRAWSSDAEYLGETDYFVTALEWFEKAVARAQAIIELPPTPEFGYTQSGEIFALLSDGTSVQITDNLYTDYTPAWSRDGSKIAFTSIRPGDGALNKIYLMNADGTGEQRLTDHGYYDGDPTWHPDGTVIAYESNQPALNQEAGFYEIWVMNADGSGSPQQLTNTATTFGNVLPEYSPDGSKIVFESGRDGGEMAVYLMDSDGSNQQRLTTSTRMEMDAKWSPDGKKIVWTRQRVAENYFDIWTMNADGTDQVAIVADFANADPVWSRDGSRIFFTTQRIIDGSWFYGICSVLEDGTGLRAEFPVLGIAFLNRAW